MRLSKAFGAGVLAGIVIASVVFLFLVEKDKDTDHLEERGNKRASVSQLSPGQIWFYSNLRPEHLVRDETLQEKFSGPVIFSSHVAYNREFANSFGLPEKYLVANLPDFIGYIGFDFKYAGRFRRCNLTMLVRKDAPIQLADRDIYQPFNGTSLNMMLGALPSRKKGSSETIAQREYRLGYHEYDSSKAVRDLVHGSFGLLGTTNGSVAQSHSFVSLNLNILKTRQFEEWNFVSTTVGCGPLTEKIFQFDVVEILARPVGHSYLRGITPATAEEFVKIPIPQDLIEALRADFSKIDFSR